MNAEQRGAIGGGLRAVHPGEMSPIGCVRVAGRLEGTDVEDSVDREPVSSSEPLPLRTGGLRVLMGRLILSDFQARWSFCDVAPVS